MICLFREVNFDMDDRSALFRRLRGGPALTGEEMRSFHDGLLEETLASGLAPHYTVQRMKELWYYLITLFPDSARLYKALNKSRDLPAYRSAVASLFAQAAFEPGARFRG